MTNSNLPSPAEIYAQEAKQLKEIWMSSADGRLAQAQFGEVYDIGGQSAVANFLNGRSPLSLKAALGFARGLKCRVQDFSPRLAKEALGIAEALGELKEYEPGSRPSWFGEQGSLHSAVLLGEITCDDAGLCHTVHRSDLSVQVEFWTPMVDPYALRITGDGFYPRYRSGELLILSDKAPPLVGCEALVKMWDARKYLRIWNGMIDGEVQLLPLSPGLPPLTLKEDDIEFVERVLGCAPRDVLRQNSHNKHK
jgi:hypothetical protein